MVTSMSDNQAPDVEELRHDECWRLMRTADIGRMAVVIGDHPEIFPVNFVVDGATVVFRTAAGTKLTAVLSAAAVAFETDGMDEKGRAWSVMMYGPAHQVLKMDELLETGFLPLASWQSGSKERFVRIQPTSLTGRRFKISIRRDVGDRGSQISDARWALFE
jgi:uncharacterized protein